MYYVYVKKPNSFSDDLLGEFKDFEAAQARAAKAKTATPEIKYRIEESSGGFNSYGELLTDIIEEG